MSMTRDRWLGLIPGLLMGAASIAKGQGMFGGDPLTSAEKAGNNSVWDNLGSGKLANGEAYPLRSVGAPMQLPGASLASADAAPKAPAQPNLAALQMLPGLSGGLSGSPTLPAMAAAPPPMPALQPPPQAQAWAPPQQPPVGLLSDPNEETRKRFLQSQGVGPAMNIAMR